MNQRFAWGHININVQNLEASIDFYRKLGFAPTMPGIPYLNLNAKQQSRVPGDASEALGWPAHTRGRACIMQLDAGFPKIDLTELVELEQREPLRNVDRGLVRLCLVSRNLNADYRHLLEQGVKFLTPPRVCHERLAEVACCVDPDGTLIEVLQVYLDRWGQHLK